MNLRHLGRVAAGFFFCGQIATAQISQFPFVEHFDTTPDSTIPLGWQTSTNRRPGGDFFASLSSPRSSPHCLLSQNASIAQSLTSPSFDFSNRTPDKLQFYVARSSTHTSGLLVEASVDDGATFSVPLSDTLRNPGTTSYVLSSIQIPRALANQRGVRVRWRIVGGAGGPTATFRIDDVSLTTLISYDLAATSITIAPRFATHRDSLFISVSLKNCGIQTVAGYSVTFSLDLNANGIADPPEEFAILGGDPIHPSDSTTIVAGHSPVKAGDYRFLAVASAPADERRSNDTVSATATIGYPAGTVLVNEVMYAPTGDEPEWIELLNCCPDTVNLKDWRISDSYGTTKTLITSADVVLPPAGFCIVAKDASFASVHPSLRCPVVLANFSSLSNSTPDAVVLYEPRLLTIDSLFYSPSWGGQGGKSLERIDTALPSTDRANWGQTVDISGSTPGRTNSIARLANDLAITRYGFQFVETTGGILPEISAVVRNVGRNPVSSFSLRLSNDLNRDGTPEPGESVVSFPSPTVLWQQDSATFSFVWSDIPSGESSLIASIDFPADERARNDTASLILSTRYPFHSMVINEIMFDPLPVQCEWIEFYSRGNYPVDLKDWRFSDRPTGSGSTNSYTIAASSAVVRPGAFVVVAADSSIFSLFPLPAESQRACTVFVLKTSGDFGLNADGDNVFLRDLTGTTIDSVSYTPGWHRPDVVDTKGRSLERVNPDLDSNLPANWTTCVLSVGGTPGGPNSVLTRGVISTSSLTFTPNPFSPDGDGFEDFCLVQYRLGLSVPLIHARIYDMKGRLVRTLANSKISSPQGELLWDGLNDDRQRVRIGPYIVLIQAVESDGTRTTSLKGVVVVAGKL